MDRDFDGRLSFEEFMGEVPEIQSENVFAFYRNVTEMQIRVNLAFYRNTGSVVRLLWENNSNGNTIRKQI